MRQGGERSRQVPKRQRATAWKSELAEINAKARQEGMSYGQYVGLMYCEERDEMERRRRYDEKKTQKIWLTGWIRQKRKPKATIAEHERIDPFLRRSAFNDPDGSRIYQENA